MTRSGWANSPHTSGYRGSRERRQSYRQQVEELRGRDSRAEQPGSLTLATAKQLYRMMAIKDEYEVARLYSDGEFQRKLAERFEGDYRLRFNLAPPIIAQRDPVSGELVKREFGPWILALFGLLAPLKRLRGTALDIFSYSAERRRERRDLADYRALLQTLSAGLNDDNYDTAVALVQGAADLRGYGHVKDRNREKVHAQREMLMRRFRGEDVDAAVVRIVEAA